MFQSSDFNQRIIVEQKTKSKNGIGEEVITWAPLASIWAKVMPLRGNAFYQANQQQHTLDARFLIRQRSDLTTDMRIQWNGRPYDIVNLIPGTDKYRGTIEIMATNGVRDGR